MAELQQPLLKEAADPVQCEEDGESTAPEMQGPVLDIDMIISRLLSYKDKPGKQV